MQSAYGHTGGGESPGEANFDTAKEKQWRIARIAGLLLVYLFPAFFTGPDGIGFQIPSFGFLIPDSIYELVLWAAIGAQIYFMQKPLQDQPKTFVYRWTTWGTELFLIIPGVFLGVGLSLQSFPGLYALPYPVFMLIVTLIDLIPVAMITLRGTVVIDGKNRKIYSLGLIPKVRSFDQVTGLGKLEVRVVNRGYSTYHLVVFFQDGKHWRLEQMGAERIPMEAARVTQATGLPNRPQ
ncbi:MAG: hypothetical protein JJ863_25195 [Deltaproteobacteria bacterium]|nr:hypothetical protein [Deltaproteobacteria bacterium]